MLAQAIPIALTPLITRLYTPSELGLLTLFTAITSTLGIVSSGRYEIALTLPKRNSDAFSILSLSRKILLSVCTVVLLITLFFPSQLTAVINEPNIQPYLYLTSISILLIGLEQIYYNWNTRVKNFKANSISKILKSGISTGTNVTVGALGFGTWGLFGGYLLGLLSSASYLHKTVSKSTLTLKTDVNRQKIQATRYSNHPKYLVFSHGINMLYTQAPVVLITKYFDLFITGQYSLAIRLVNIPGMLIANSIGDVFRQKASELYSEKGCFDQLFINTLKKTFLIGLVPFCFFYLTSPHIFSFIFGEEWEKAGHFAQILSISAFTSFVTSPADKAALIVGAIRYIAVWQTSKLLSTTAACWYSISNNKGAEHLLYAIVIINGLHHAIDAWVEYNLSKKEDERFNLVRAKHKK